MEIRLWKIHRQRSELSTTRLPWSVKCSQQCIIGIRSEMFALQRLPKLLKFTRSQIFTAWDSYMAALLWRMLNNKMESCIVGYWHGFCRATLWVFGRPFFSIARWNQIWQCTWQGIFFPLLKAGWTLLQSVQWLKHGCTTAARQSLSYIHCLTLLFQLLLPYFYI